MKQTEHNRDIESFLKEKGTIPKRVNIHITKETEGSGLDRNILETTRNEVQALVILSFGKNTPRNTLVAPYQQEHFTVGQIRRVCLQNPKSSYSDCGGEGTKRNRIRRKP